MTKFSQIAQNGSPALTDYMVGVTSTNSDDIVTLQNLLTLFFNNVPNTSIKSSNIDFTTMTLGYAQITSTFSTTSSTQVLATGLSITVNIPPGARVKVTAFCSDLNGGTGSGPVAFMGIWDGAVGSGTQRSTARSPAYPSSSPATLMAVFYPTAGSHTFNVGLNQAFGGTANISASAIAPAFIMAEICG